MGTNGAGNHIAIGSVTPQLAGARGLSVAYSTRAWMMANDAVRVELPERAWMVALRHFGLGVESATWRPS